MRFALALAAAALCACGGSDSSTPATVDVAIGASGLSPQSASAPSAGSIRFTNNDTKNHQIASAACASLGSPVLSTGQSFTATLPAGPKTCTYSDGLDPSNAVFQGQVVVAAAGAGGGGGGGSGY
jgi:plastocyanin